MPSVTVILRKGNSQVVKAEVGASVMEAIRNAGIDEVVALCSGSCSCATCHVYVEAGGGSLPPIAADEADMLECSLHREPNSRLSCQLAVDAALQGLVVRIAPEE
jgi:2Fe-2S ferredoxin